RDAESSLCNRCEWVVPGRKTAGTAETTERFTARYRLACDCGHSSRSTTRPAHPRGSPPQGGGGGFPQTSHAPPSSERLRRPLRRISIARVVQHCLSKSHHCEPHQGPGIPSCGVRVANGARRQERPHMKFGIATFVNDDAIDTVSLAR